LPINPATGREGAPVEQVFGGERQTPHSVFDKRRREGGWTPERPNGTVVANHKAADLAIACPDCRDLLGKNDVRMFTRPDAGYYCMNGHRYNDYEQLLARNPAKLAYKGIVARQDGFVKMTIEMPGSVAELIKAKFGDKLSATLAGVMDVLSGERCILMGESDVKRLQDRLGEEVKSPAFIVGKIWELKEQTITLQETVDKLRENLRQRMSGRGEREVTDTMMMLDLGELSGPLLQKAQEKEWTPDMYVLEAVRLAIEGSWI
jgi:hypothetical protein